MSLKDKLEIGYWITSLAILIATVYYIYYAPIKAVKVGRELNDQQNKDSAKRQLFLTLFSYRGSPIHAQFVNSLNQIDVVFNDSPKVIAAWHKYYEALHLKNVVNQEENWLYLRTALLSEMATELGYGKLTQIDITKHYYPEGHDFQYRSELDRQQATYEYHKLGAELYKKMIENTSTREINSDKEEKS
jgi:hypothetical protein